MAGFGQESFVMVDTDGLGRHADVPGEPAIEAAGLA